MFNWISQHPLPSVDVDKVPFNPSELIDQKVSDRHIRKREQGGMRIFD